MKRLLTGEKDIMKGYTVGTADSSGEYAAAGSTGSDT